MDARNEFTISSAVRLKTNTALAPTRFDVYIVVSWGNLVILLPVYCQFGDQTWSLPISKPRKVYGSIKFLGTYLHNPVIHIGEYGFKDKTQLCKCDQRLSLMDIISSCIAMGVCGRGWSEVVVEARTRRKEAALCNSASASSHECDQPPCLLSLSRSPIPCPQSRTRTLTKSKSFIFTF